MKYIQRSKENVIVAIMDSKPELMEDINGIWCEVKDSDIVKGTNGKLYYKHVDEEEIAEYNRESERAELINYLSSTDYVSNKVIDSGLLKADFLKLTENEKYCEVFEKRARARARINELETN